MQKPTVNGVYYDVPRSPLCVSRNGYRYYFSSQTHLDKFLLKAPIKEEWLNDSMSRRFKFEFQISVIADMQLYMQIETRGFYVVDEISELDFNSPDELCVIVDYVYGKDEKKWQDGSRQQGSSPESGKKSGCSTETLIG